MVLASAPGRGCACWLLWLMHLHLKYASNDMLFITSFLCQAPPQGLQSPRCHNDVMHGLITNAGVNMNVTWV